MYILSSDLYRHGCRGLLFLCRALQRMQDDTAVELHVCFKRSYDEVLSHHHTFIVRSLSAVRHQADSVVLCGAGFKCLLIIFGTPDMNLAGRRASSALPPRLYYSHFSRR